MCRTHTVPGLDLGPGWSSSDTRICLVVASRPVVSSTFLWVPVGRQSGLWTAESFEGYCSGRSGHFNLITVDGWVEEPNNTPNYVRVHSDCPTLVVCFLFVILTRFCVGLLLKFIRVTYCGRVLVSVLMSLSSFSLLTSVRGSGTGTPYFYSWLSLNGFRWFQMDRSFLSWNRFFFHTEKGKGPETLHWRFGNLTWRTLLTPGTRWVYQIIALNTVPGTRYVVVELEVSPTSGSGRCVDSRCTHSGSFLIRVLYRKLGR